MGFVLNISEVTGFTGSGASSADIWDTTVDLSDPGVTTVSGDFDLDNALSGAGGSEAPSYSFSAVPTTFGTLNGNTSTGEFTFTIDRQAVIDSGSDQVITFTVTGNGFPGDTDTVNITILICVARGTRIATPKGERFVEDLTVGDRVLTADGRSEVIRWIGSRAVSAEELTHDQSLRPIRIRQDALGPSLPQHDLIVSPQHRIRIEAASAEMLFGSPEVLVPAKGLIDDAAIALDYAVEEVEYFHVAFDNHEVIITNGLATESFHPGPTYLDGMDTRAAEELYKIFPELRADPASFGPAALPSLKPWEGALLAACIRTS